MNELDERSPDTVTRPLWTKEEFTNLLHLIAKEQAPRLFAIVEEYGEQEDGRVAAYGLAYPDHADVNSVEGDFHLVSQSPERARQLFEISAGSRGVRTHLVWLTSAPKDTEEEG
ncbi:hypothetical protein F4560_006748 [Saccharothrix ecbatanensis]|uniref:Uncharacterized protein n=1 Tax=Saccharothrix ecbatanensis TaxID=1105145 RepID=A0A7W9M4D2_9PSEU|nr:hypothetical protein [Saccharothrix ecbatanensis]MBB5806980.1 hypothetical protein [Saccharothrix ecbatanensis]